MLILGTHTTAACQYQMPRPEIGQRLGDFEPECTESASDQIGGVGVDRCRRQGLLDGLFAFGHQPRDLACFAMQQHLLADSGTTQLLPQGFGAGLHILLLA